MVISLIEDLPKIVSQGKKEARKILDGLSSKNRITLQTNELVVELDNYILLSPNAMPLDDKNKEKLEKVIAQDPLSLIEYWSIDPDYDGEVFRSKWQYDRDNTFND